MRSDRGTELGEVLSPATDRTALFLVEILGLTPVRAGRCTSRVRAMMPEAEIGELIVELRSVTAGAGSFTRQFDRMAEVTGRAADQIIAAHRVAA